MNMLKQALLLWKQNRNRKGIPLQRRLIVYFAAVSVFLLAAVAVLLLFGITGSSRSAVHNYLETELFHLHEAVSDHSGQLTVQGIEFAEEMAASADDYFKKNGIRADELSAHPELLEPLLAEQMPHMLSMMERSTVSGVFILLDATVKPDAENAAVSRAGIFLKKTQTDTRQVVSAKRYYLRGPAQIARDNSIELLGQWSMEYDVTDEPFFGTVMETARKNPDKALSRLYLWTGRVTLKNNSESGFLLCVPLRCTDGTVFGVCGVEVSDRMFKNLYSPGKSNYSNVFSLASPVSESVLLTTDCLIAGNYYQTGTCMESDLSPAENKNGFVFYCDTESVYGGLHASLRLYPSGSAYNDEWAVAVMMPEAELHQAINGSIPYLLTVLLFLLLISFGASVFISRRYLRPVTDALDRIKAKDYTPQENIPYLEINDLMEFLAQQDEEAKKRNIVIAIPSEDSLPMFEQFLENVKTLSPAERNVFNLYIRGYKAQEIADSLHLSINTIKTHNRRIFAKLNVSTRKELLVYINMMKEKNMPEEV